MFKSKFNLYNTEWLDLVFSERNKNYGAYELRKHYNSNMLKALFFTATIFAAVIFTASLLLKHDPVNVLVKPLEPEVVIDLSKIISPKTETSSAKKNGKLQSHPAVTTQKIVAPRSEVLKPVKDDLVKEELKPTLSQNVTPGLQDIPGDIPALNTSAGGNGNKTGTAEGTGNTDNEVKTTGVLEKLPEFPGGMEAWSKFLSKNLHYPEQAAQEGVSGKVFISFIVEKDGRITDIKVIKAAGYGFDEEAKRVLKMAPQWKPGIQNGKAVRVRYTIPINFTISQ